MSWLRPPGEKILISLLIQILLCISEAIPRYKVSYYFLRIKIFFSKWHSCCHLRKKILISLLIQILLCISVAIPRYKVSYYIFKNQDFLLQVALLLPPGEENLNFPPDPDTTLYLGSNSEIQS